MTKEFRNATFAGCQHCIDHRRAKCKLGGSFQSNVESNRVMCSVRHFSMLAMNSHLRDGNASFWSWALRSEAARTRLRRVSFATWSGSVPSVRRQQCAPRRLPAGPGVRGKPSLSRSSSPLRARPWAVLGRRPRYLRRATALHWTGCSTSPPTQGPAACPCGPNSGPRAVVGVVVGAR